MNTHCSQSCTFSSQNKVFKMFSLCFIVFSFTYAIALKGYDVTATYGHLCKPGNVYTWLPWDCSGFIQCTKAADGVFFARWMPCTWHLQYDSKAKVCVLGRGSCQNMTQVAIEQCELKPDLKFANPENCALFYDCKQTTAKPGLKVYENECPYPELFDQEKQKCMPAKLVNCKRRFIPKGKCDYKLGCDPGLCKGKTAGKHAIPGEEFGKEFVQCSNDKILNQSACSGKDEIFDPVKKTCTSQYDASVVEYCKFDPSAMFADATKCSLYYDCRKQTHFESMKPYQGECPYPTLFDSRKQSCLPFDQVSCGNRPVPKKPCDYTVGRCIGHNGCIPCSAKCEPDQDGPNPYPDNPYQYLMCRDGRTVDILSCAVGRPFNPQLRQCETECNCAAEIRALAVIIKTVENFLKTQGLPSMSCNSPVTSILNETRRYRPGADIYRCPGNVEPCLSMTCVAGQMYGTWDPDKAKCCNK